MPGPAVHPPHYAPIPVPTRLAGQGAEGGVLVARRIASYTAWGATVCPQQAATSLSKLLSPTLLLACACAPSLLMAGVGSPPAAPQTLLKT